MSDPYEEIRTRMAVDHVRDGSDIVEVETVQPHVDNNGVVAWTVSQDAQRAVLTPQPHYDDEATTSRRPWVRIQAFNRARAVGQESVAERLRQVREAEEAAETAAYEKQLAESMAFRDNWVPAEDLPAQETIARLRKLVDDMEADWRKLNEIYNATARNRGWCTDYEDRAREYNRQLRVLQLVGREEHWRGSRNTWVSLDGNDYRGHGED